MLRGMQPEREVSQTQQGQQQVLEIYACLTTPSLASFPAGVPARHTLIFFGSGLFWVTATAIKAITAKVEKNPRMSRIFLVQDIFCLLPVTRAKEGCQYPSSPSYHTPQRCSGTFLWSLSTMQHLPLPTPCSHLSLHVLVQDFLRGRPQPWSPADLLSGAAPHLHGLPCASW